MPFDYYELLKEQRESDEYTETTDLVRKSVWSETFYFKLSQRWLKIEDLILIKLYAILRYT